MSDSHLIRKKIGARIKYFREEKQISQERFSESLGITQAHLSAIERGNRSPSISVLVKIIDNLEVTPNDSLMDVVKAGYSIKANWLSQNISHLPKKEQEKILKIVEILADEER